MAITKLTRIKEAPRGNKAARLKANLFYICDDDKTGGGIWVGGNAGGSPEVAYRTMVENKKFWSKEEGSQAFHYILSFPPDSGVDEALAFKIAEEFCHELLGDDFYYIFAVHNDKEHLHVHITFDSVSKVDGYKFHSPQGDWELRIQPITDRICEKYHLPTLGYDSEKRSGRNYGDWKKKDFSEEEKEQYYTWNDIVRDDIDEAIGHSQSYEDFLSYLKNEGYEIPRDQKVLSLKPQGRERAIRTSRLGEGYAKEEIIQRIANRELTENMEARFKTYGNREEMREIIYTKIVHVGGWKMSPMQKQFWKRWNDTYFIRKPNFMTPEERSRHKQDILEIRKLSDSLRYMIDYDIKTPAELSSRQEELQQEQAVLNKELKACQTKLYRKRPVADVARYFRLQKKDRASPFEEDTELQKEELIKKIETVCPFEEAVSLYQDLNGQIADLQKLIKDNKKEQHIVDDIFQLFYQMEPEKELTRSETQTKRKENSKNDRDEAR